MIDENIFYDASMYDNIARLVFKDYAKNIEIAANAVPSNINSGLEIGIGTGNLTFKVRDKIESKLRQVCFYGLDTNAKLVSVAQDRISGLKIMIGDMIDTPFLRVDMIYSSMTIHHTPTERREELLRKIAHATNMGFVNFDFALDKQTTYRDVINLVKDYAMGNISEEVLQSFKLNSESKKEIPQIIENRMLKNDNYMSLDFQREVFENMGMNFEVLRHDRPYVVYSAFWPDK